MSLLKIANLKLFRGRPTHNELGWILCDNKGTLPLFDQSKNFGES